VCTGSSPISPQFTRCTDLRLTQIALIAHHRLSLILTVAAEQGVHSAIDGYLENSRPKAANVHSLEALQVAILRVTVSLVDFLQVSQGASRWLVPSQYYLRSGSTQFETPASAHQSAQDSGFLTANMMKRLLRWHWKSFKPMAAVNSLSSCSSHHCSTLYITQHS